MSSRQIKFTKNYRLFEKDPENRTLNEKKHKKLFESMQTYGFLACFPIVVRRGPDGKLIVREGQHRVTFAETLSLGVWYVEEDTEFDIAVINCTAKTWTLKDYAEKHKANGLAAYEEGLEFAERHDLPIGTTFALLAGTTGFANCQASFIDGTFEIKDRNWAEAVARLYVPMTLLSPSIKSARLLEACMAACRVKGFDPKRLLSGAEGRREKLVSYSTRDAYLEMMEDVYNFRRSQKVPLKIPAIEAMRKRNPANGSKKTKPDVA